VWGLIRIAEHDGCAKETEVGFGGVNTVDLLGEFQDEITPNVCDGLAGIQLQPFSGATFFGNGISPNERRVHTGADPRQSVSSRYAWQTPSNVRSGRPRGH
jgi:hypothetical protein